MNHSHEPQLHFVSDEKAGNVLENKKHNLCVVQPLLGPCPIR